MPISTPTVPAIATSPPISPRRSAGTWSGTAARLRVRGAGADIWDRADAFNFVWQPAHGDVDIVVGGESGTTLYLNDGGAGEMPACVSDYLQ